MLGCDNQAPFLYAHPHEDGSALACDVQVFLEKGNQAPNEHLGAELVLTCTIQRRASSQP